MYTGSNASLRRRVFPILGILFVLGANTQFSFARQNIRSAFFDVYPDAVGTVLDTVPSQLEHCGVCHYDFTGGGSRNPYGLLLENALPGFPNNPNGRRQAVLSVEGSDADVDGFSTFIEMTDTVTFSNTPTFPGLSPANLSSVSNVDTSEIQFYLVPTTGGDTTPPSVTVTVPNGGETLVGNGSTTVEWTAGDASGVAAIRIDLSLDNGLSFKPVALNLPNSGSHTWFPANRPTAVGIVRVTATDNAFNTGSDDSDAPFSIISPPGGLVPSTLRDFDQPGTQPFEGGILNPPEACEVCHGNYDSAVEPFYTWQGSMMAHASRDLLFQANMTIANQDAPDSGDLCLRCHLPRGWLQGRSVPTDGSQMLVTDESGVSCDLCHRLVDPIYDPGENPPEDQNILASLSFPGSEFGNGMAVVDPTGARRGPFLNAATGHPVLVSPFHREAAFCGTCHDVSNPAFEKDGNGNYVPNAFDEPASDFSAHVLAPVERTYSEWFYSEYNTPSGVYAPDFGGNLDYVSTCQDCHMRDVTGEGCNFGTPPTRDDLPLHDMTGGSTWLPGLIGALYPGEVNEAALQSGIERARYMLDHAADLSLLQDGSQLKVTVTNNTGHKLPTGYPEGRRIWINVKFYDGLQNLISESGAYNLATGELAYDAQIKIYEIKPGLDATTAPLVGASPGPSFHFVLNNAVFKDNRIPPRGFTNAAYADFGGAPVAYAYADGQFWDDTFYTIPQGAASAEVALLYQSTSKEFVEFLRDENQTDSLGQEMYDLWSNNGKCPPEEMESESIGLTECSDHSDCDDGLYCNGSELCDGNGQCQSGPAPCDDAVDCTIDLCDESSDTCTHNPDNSACDNGLYCDGVEACDLTLGCQQGTVVDCDDGIGCTVDSCNETSESCDHESDDAACDNNLYCDGMEFCDPLLDCQSGPPIDCDDGLACTIDSCNESIDACDNVADDSVCTNNLYCDGTEYCDPLLDCQPGTPVDCDDGVGCTIDSCDDNIDSCTHIPDDAVCENGLFCDGTETCDLVQGCLTGTDPCVGQSCDEFGDRCTQCLVDADCDDGLYCNGVETCNTVDGSCEAGTAIICDDAIACTQDSCNDATDQCDNVPDHTSCDDGLFCTGVELCDPGSGCLSSGNPCGQSGACDDSTDSCGCLPPTVTVVGPRYLEITPQAGDDDVGLIVTGVDDDVACITSYVQADGFVLDQSGSPVFMTPGEWGTVTVSGAGLIAGRTYDVQVDCDQANPGTVLSEPVSVVMWRWGDADNSGIIDVLDISRSVDAFRGDLLSSTLCQVDADCLSVAPNVTCDLDSGFCLRVRTENADLLSAQGCTPDHTVTILDIVAFVDAFRGIPHSCVGPCAAP